MSPTSSPSSSVGSPPDSSPADTTVSVSDAASTTTTRPSFVPLTFPSFSRFPPSSSSESYHSTRTHKQLQSPLIQPPRLTSETAAATTGRHGEFHHDRDHDYAAVNPASEEESENAQGINSSQRSSQTGKKKRTRTLTTPYQSAVLHALLAQSRFPTTAMREEVGRSIGLSARKVQVWFQNQRQKARKPRNQGRSVSADPSQPFVPPPPQFGPFSPTTSILNSATTESIPTAGSSSSTDLSGKPSSFGDDLTSPTALMMRGLSIPNAPGASSSIKSEFHMDPSAISNYSSAAASISMYNEQRQFHHPDHMDDGGMPHKIEMSPDSLRSSQPNDSRKGHTKWSSIPSQQSYSYSSPLPVSQRALNPNPPLSSVYPFTSVATGAPSGRAEKDPSIILPPLRLNSPSGSMNPYNRRREVGLESSNSNMPIMRPDSQLRYSASFPSYQQDSTGARGGVGVATDAATFRSPSSSSIPRSSAPIFPPPFTLQPRPQWDWDRPLGIVLPSIGPPPDTNLDSVCSSGLRQQPPPPNFMHPLPRPRTASDPTLPVLETRQSALLTEPWPLPPRNSIDRPLSRQVVERQQQYDMVGPSGEKISSETQTVVNPTTSDRATSQADSQQRESRSSTFTLPPRERVVERSSSPAQASRSQIFEEDRTRHESILPRPSHFS